MFELDLRLISYGLWALGSLGAWGVVFVDDWKDYRVYRDRRARRELLSNFGLFLTALASFGSLIILILGQDVPGLRGFAFATAAGGFLAAGIVQATLGRKKR